MLKWILLVRHTATHLSSQLFQLKPFIILYPASFVAQYLVCLLDLVKLIDCLRLQSGVLHLVWMAFQHELSMCTPNLRKLRIFEHTEGFVWIRR